MNRLVASLLGALVALALLTSCSGSDEVEASPTTTTTDPPLSTLPPLPPSVAPLTGVSVDEPLMRPALVIKIDNHDGRARPQAGINAADIVYEEQVEGGLTRFAAVFHSQEADPVGPVRSGRTTDVGIVTPLRRPLYAYSGANGGTEAILADAPIVNIGAETFFAEAYYRQSGRSEPYNLFTDTPTLWGLTPEDAEPPTPLFEYREDGVEAAGEPASRLEVDFGGAGSVPVMYVWDPAAETWFRWQNGSAHLDADGTQIAPENVVVQFVEYRDTGQTDSAGSPVPEAQLVGEGDVWVLTGGHWVVGRWQRDVLEAPTELVDTEGAPIELTPGRTWVELTPVGAAAEVQTCAANPGAISCR